MTQKRDEKLGPWPTERLNHHPDKFPHAKLSLREVSDAGATVGSELSHFGEETTEAPSSDGTADLFEASDSEVEDLDDDEFVSGHS